MKNAITNFLKRFKDKAQAFRVSELAGAFREFAVFKSRKQAKKPKSTKQAYEWGTLGLSQVSEAIKKQHHGIILSRRERKQLAKDKELPFTAFYNGPVQRGRNMDRNIGRSKYNGKGALIRR